MPPHQVSRPLSPAPSAPGEARQFVVAACRDWGLDGVVDTVELLTSELVTNVVLHAETDLMLTVQLRNRSVLVGVHDDDPRIPTPRRPRADRDARMGMPLATLSTGGRGLLLVESCADEWGVDPAAAGKTVWFRVDATHQSV